MREGGIQTDKGKSLILKSMSGHLTRKYLNRMLTLHESVKSYDNQHNCYIRQLWLIQQNQIR